MKLTDDSYVYQEIQYLRGVADRLSAYCHRDTCNQIERCPVDCTECRYRLDLHTAIAWYYAREIDIVCKEVEGQYISWDWLADELKYAHRLTKFVVTLVEAHKDKYEELYRTIKDTEESIRLLIDYLYEYIE